MSNVHERGFTLLEILVSMAIIGLLAVPMIGAIGQTVVRTEDNNTRIRALVPMENAGRWLGGDIRIAQDTSLATSSSDVTLGLTWTDWADASQYDEYSAGSVAYTRYRATYSLNGTDLERLYEVCDGSWDVDAGACQDKETPPNPVEWTATTAVVASPVTSVLFKRTGDLIVIDLTSFPKGPTFPGEARTYRVRGSILMAPVPV